MIDDNKHKLFENVPVPPVPAGDLLVKVVAVAINPVDWKLPEYHMSTPDSGCGCDLAGTVVAVGSDVTGFSVGDQVFTVNSGYQLGNKNLLGAAFAEYVYANPHLTFRGSLAPHPELTGPDDLIKAGQITTFEGAASVPLAALTSGLSLSHFFNNKIEYLADGSIKSTDPDAGSKYILIWGGATSVGQYGIQILKAAGYKPVVTASPKNFDYLTSLGAHKLFDYRDPDVVSKIRDFVGPNLVHVFDTISLPDSWKACHDAIPAEAKNINMVSTLPFQDYDIGEKRPDVTMFQEFVFIPSHNRFDLSKEPENDGQRQYVNATDFVKCINARIKAGTFQHNAVKIYEKKGVQNVEGAVEYFKTANVSAFKLIVHF